MDISKAFVSNNVVTVYAGFAFRYCFVVNVFVAAVALVVAVPFAFVFHECA